MSTPAKAALADEANLGSPGTRLVIDQDRATLATIADALVSPRRATKVVLLEGYLQGLTYSKFNTLVGMLSDQVKDEYQQDALSQLYVLMLGRGLQAGSWDNRNWLEKRREWDRLAQRVLSEISAPDQLAYAMLESYALPTFMRHLYLQRAQLSQADLYQQLRFIARFAVLCIYNLICMSVMLFPGLLLCTAFVTLVLWALKGLCTAMFDLLTSVPDLVMRRTTLSDAGDKFSKTISQALPTVTKPWLRLAGVLFMPLLAVLSSPFMLFDALQFRKYGSTTFARITQPMTRWAMWAVASYYPTVVLIKSVVMVAFCFIPGLSWVLPFLLVPELLSLVGLATNLMYQQLTLAAPSSDARQSAKYVDGQNPLCEELLSEVSSASDDAEYGGTLDDKVGQISLPVMNADDSLALRTASEPSSGLCSCVIRFFSGGYHLKSANHTSPAELLKPADGSSLDCSI